MQIDKLQERPGFSCDRAVHGAPLSPVILAKPLQPLLFRVIRFLGTDPRRMLGSVTEGREIGSIYWRFMLPEGEIETSEARLVPFEEVASR